MHCAPSPSIFSVAAINGEIDANLVVRVKDLEAEKDTLLGRVARMQEQLIAAQRESADSKDTIGAMQKAAAQVRHRVMRYTRDM